MDLSDFCIRPTWNKTSYSICLVKYAELFRYGVVRLLPNLSILLQAKVLPALMMDVARWRLFVVGTPDVAIVAESESGASFSSVCITSAVWDEYLYTFVLVLVEERTIGPEAKSGKTSRLTYGIVQCGCASRTNFLRVLRDLFRIMAGVRRRTPSTIFLNSVNASLRSTLMKSSCFIDSIH